MERVGEVNQYVCDDCGHTITTIVRYDGTTPAFLFRFCKSPDGCKGDMSSAWYRVAPGLTPEWEWYKPDAEELAKLDAGSQDHVEQGGLLLRRIEVSDEIEPETRKALVKMLRAWLGEEGLGFFRRVKKQFGTLIATLPAGHEDNPMPIRHPVHFHEGMGVRNFVRESTAHKLSDDWYENGWVDLVEEAIAHTTAQEAMARDAARGDSGDGPCCRGHRRP